MHQGKDHTGSTVLLDEYFSSGDERFLEELSKIDAVKKLAAFADRWKKDPRPWAREQIFRYLSRPLDRPGHHPLVKRLFKHAEENRDHQMMAAFMPVFDRLVRSVRRKRWRWDRDVGRAMEEEYLTYPRNGIPASLIRTYTDPMTGRQMRLPVRIKPGFLLFSHHTRHYLRRRVWRYFRRTGYQHPDDYPAVVAEALKAYRDDDFERPEHILDNWSLMQAAFRRSDALSFGSSRVRLAPEKHLSDLSAAPMFPELWEKSPSMPILFSIVIEAQSHLVRVWAMDVLRQAHTDRLVDVPAETMTVLFDHDDESVKTLAGELLMSATGLDSAPMTLWLRLLETHSPSSLAVICNAIGTHVDPGRFTLDQLIALACRREVPAAALGFDFLKQRSFDAPEDLDKLDALADAACPAVAERITGWVLGLIGTPDRYDPERMTLFFDSLLPETRRAAWAWLIDDSPGYDDPRLWARIVETPFDDLRLALVAHLEDRHGKARGNHSPGTDPDRLADIWRSVLLGVHRGGRQKPAAIRQLARAVKARPELADRLLPVLAVAVRSVRGPEMRSGLAAVVELAGTGPDLAGKVKDHLPELILPEEVFA